MNDTRNLEYPSPARIACYVEALQGGVITFQEADAQGTCLVDLGSPLIAALDADWPDDFERAAALWRFAQSAIQEHAGLVEQVRVLKENVELAKTILLGGHALAAPCRSAKIIRENADEALAVLESIEA